MSVINSAKKEINFKVIYYGPAQSGKTTSLNQLNLQIEAKKKSKIKRVPQTESTLFFDFLPLASSDINGYKTHFQVYTVPGQDLYENSRRILLKGVDGIIFVADSQIDRIEDNVKSLKELAAHLKNMGYALQEVPLVIQYNKRDLDSAVSLDELRRVVNSLHVPDFETTAIKGEGVLPAFQCCLREVVSSLKSLA